MERNRAATQQKKTLCMLMHTLLKDAFATLLLGDDGHEAGLFAQEIFELPLSTFPKESLLAVGRRFKHAMHPDHIFRGASMIDGRLHMPDAPFAAVPDPSRWTRDWNLACENVEKAATKETTLLGVHLERMREAMAEDEEA